MRRPIYATSTVFLALAGWVYAEDFDGKQVAAALARRNIAPAPRLPDGHPDLGNDKGSWEPPGIGDMAGTGGGFAGTAQPERKIDVPFLPWTKAALVERNANFTKDDPEGYCLPPGIPRMYAASFPFQIYQLPNRILFVFEGGAHMWRVVYMDGRKHTPPEKLHRPLGRGHPRSGCHGFQRPKLDRRRRTRAYRATARHRAFHASERADPPL